MRGGVNAGCRNLYQRFGLLTRQTLERHACCQGAAGQGQAMGFMKSLGLTFSVCCPVSIMYIFILIRALACSPDGICSFLQTVDDAHSCVNPTELNHVQDCRLQLSSIVYVLDRYVAAHFIGWFVKALIIPNAPLLWVASILFELIERLLVYWIPTFQECWWDSVIMDVFLCNALGIHLGCCLYRWARTRSKLYATSLRCTPFSFFVILCCVLLTDVNAFFIKDAFLIRSASPLNIYRLVGFAVLGKLSISHLISAPTANFTTVFGLYAILLVVELFVCLTIRLQK